MKKKKEHDLVLMVTQMTVSIGLGLATFSLLGEKKWVFVPVFTVWAGFWLVVIYNNMRGKNGAS